MHVKCVVTATLIVTNSTKNIMNQFVSEVGSGFATMGNGIGQGFETAVEGTVSGVFSVGKGLFSGAKSVGKGIGGVFSGPGASEKPSGRGSRKR